MIKFLAGLVVGSLVAALVALYINKVPLLVTTEDIQQMQRSTTQNDVILAPSMTMKEIDDYSKQENTDNQRSYKFYNDLEESGDVALKQNNDNSPVRSSAGNYNVLLDTFKDANDANDMKARVALLGYAAKIDQNDQGYKVYIGPYSDEVSAYDTSQDIQKYDINNSVVENN